MTARARLFALAALTIAVCVAAGWQLAGQARGELLASDAAWANGDVRGAVLHARQAAAACVPGSNAASAGHQRLAQIARTLESRGDLDGALFAWRASHAATHATRSLWQPNVTALNDSEQAIARLLATPLPTAGSLGGLVAAPRRPALDLPFADAPPRLAWSALLFGGAVAWLTGSFRMVVLWSARAPWRGPELRWACATTCVGAAAWASGLLMS